MIACLPSDRQSVASQYTNASLNGDITSKLSQKSIVYLMMLNILCLFMFSHFIILQFKNNADVILNSKWIDYCEIIWIRGVQIS